MGSELDVTAVAKRLAKTNLRATIRPGLAATVSLGDAPARDAMPELAPVTPRLVFGATIGEGGMAIVRSAVQTSLGREVAVKTLRTSDAGEDAAVRLLREAWITGALEHPNIVPVHDLGVDERDMPILVLKRIEGTAWSGLIASPAEIRARFAADPLEWNLRRLEQVCHAISFAHSRGVLHRDLKPDNVMIGSFGEVYVLDWGIAVGLVDDGTRRLPLAADCSDIAGTPVYMAPEMLGGTGLDARTDVYLLGAILYEIATGSPPHAKDSLDATIASIAQSECAIPRSVPAELAAICRKALARERDRRFQTAEALRIAIAGFLEHRGSSAIAAEAALRLDELTAQLAGASASDRVTSYALFGQCRLGFQAALRAWPDNTTAREGLDRALAVMATHELDQGDARAAAVLLAELATPVPELAARLTAVEDDAHAKERRLQRLAADQDASYGSRARTAFLVLFGLFWATTPVIASVFPAIDVDHPTSLLVTGISLAAVTAYGVLARGPMLETIYNRGVIITVFVTLVLHGIVEATAWGIGLDMATTHVVAIAAWCGATSVAAVFLDRALVFPTLGFLVALFATVRWPAQRFWAISASLGFLLATAIYIWHYARVRKRRIAGLAELVRRRERDGA